MKKILALLMAVVMLFTLAACGGNTDDDKAQSLAVCLASEPDTLDPALNSAVDGATLVAHLFSGLAKWAQDETGKLVIVADAAEELVEGVENEDGTVTYTYTLKEGLTWSDGQPLKASDFVFSWNRAASPALAADYSYMLEIVKGYAEMWETKETGEVDEEGNPVTEFVNPDAKLAVEATDDRTLVVTINNAVAYWNELLAFPTYYPVREDVVASEDWATDPATYVCNGAYTITGWEHNSVITLTKNDKYFDADKVTMPEIKFYLSDDANNMLTNYKNGDWLLIDDVPTNDIATLKTEYPEEFVVAGQIGTYYVSWNVNESILPVDTTLEGEEAEAAEAEIRKALALVIDRNYIVTEISQAGEVPAASFVAMGMTDADGSEFYKNAGSSEEFDGYFNASADAFEANFASAVETLKKYYTYDEATAKFTDVPALTYIYNTNDAHQAIAEYIQGAFAAIGVTVNLENQEWNTFLNTRKNGEYTVARNGWLADYNDPISFLDMWQSENSGNNDIQFGNGEHAGLKMYSVDVTDLGVDLKVENGTWAETYDALITEIKACTNLETRYGLMHAAEDLLMSTGCITPIYYYTDIYMIDDSVEGFFANPLGYKYFMYTTIK